MLSPATIFAAEKQRKASACWISSIKIYLRRWIILIIRNEPRNPVLYAWVLTLFTVNSNIWNTVERSKNLLCRNLFWLLHKSYASYELDIG